MISKIVIRILKGNEKNISRDCFLWNTLAGGINAAEAVVLMMVITRTNGLDAAGILSIAFAVGNLLMTVGKFGVRNYQVTDVKKEYAFNSYYTLRIGTVLAMVLVSGGYVFLKYIFGAYSLEKALIVLGICLVYAIESFEDVFLGYYQEEGRLDIASKIFVIRWVGIMLVFSVIAVVKRDLLLAVGVSVIVSLLCDIYLILVTGTIFLMPKIKIEGKQLYALAKQCFSLFLVAFLTYYVTNSPKYAIDKYLSEEIQAYYGYISMPVFVVELLNCFLYQPQLVDLANAWKNYKYKEFNKRTYRQYIMILGLTLVCVIGAYLLGIPILSVIYGVQLDKYRNELVILMIAGGALAFVGYTSVLLTIMRKQRLLLYNMIAITVLAIIGFGRIVQKTGMMGGAEYYLFLMILLAILNYCGTIAVVHRNRKQQKANNIIDIF